MSNEWIEINLPWGETAETDLEWPEFIEADLDAEIKAEFGITEEELIEKYFGKGCIDWIGSKTYDEYFKQSQKMRDTLRKEGVHSSNIEKELDRRLLTLHNTSVSAVIEFFAAIRPINAFIRAHEKTKECKEQNDKIKAEFQAKKQKMAANFKGRGLAKAGILMDVAGRGLILIGDINELGGSCDDCRGISNEDIVKRYKVLYSKEEV